MGAQCIQRLGAFRHRVGSVMAEVQTGYSPSTGKFFARLPGGIVQEITEQQAAQIRENPGVLSNLAGSAVEGTRNLLLGAASIAAPGEYDRQLAAQQLQQSNQELGARSMVSPVSTAVGQAVPYVAADAAALATGGIPAAIAAGVATGAAGMPEDPFLGAAVGGAAGAIPGVPAAVGATARRVVPGLVDAVSGINSPIMGMLPGQSAMAQRVMGNIDAAAPTAETPRYLKGLATPSEMEAIGAAVTPAQRMILEARSGAEVDMGRRLLWRENMTGATDAVKQTNQRAMANIVKREAGITDDVGLTDEVVNAAKTQAGQEIGRILNVASDVPMPATTWAGIREAAELAIEGQGSKSLSTILGNLERSIARNGQVMTPEAYQNAISALNKLNTPAAPAATKQGAAELRRMLSDEALKTLSPAEKQLLADARYRYKILKTLEATGVRGGSFEVNPRSFYTQWTKKTRQATRGEDVLGKTAGTLRLLEEMPANAGTTLQRGIVGLQQRAPQIGLTAGLGALGLQGLGSIFGN